MTIVPVVANAVPKSPLEFEFEMTRCLAIRYLGPISNFLIVPNKTSTSFVSIVHCSYPTPPCLENSVFFITHALSWFGSIIIFPYHCKIFPQGYLCLYDASSSLPEWSACSIEPVAWHLVYFRRTLFSVFIPAPISCLYFYLSLIHSAFGIRTCACLV